MDKLSHAQVISELYYYITHESDESERPNVDLAHVDCYWLFSE